MPRDSAGNFTLVPGNPVQSGTVVSSTWANSTLDDVSTALTDSLDRYGRGGMLAPFKFSDGTNLLPGAAWVNEPTTGFYRFDAGDLRAVVLTQDVMRWQSTGAQVWSVDDSEWQNVLTSNTIPTVVPDGTAEGQTLRWDNTGSEWEATSDLVVDSSGNVGIGSTNPSRLLQLSAAVPAIRFDDTDVSGLYHEMLGVADVGFTIRVDEGDVATGSYFSVDVDGGERMRIDSSGNVGIGTSAPTGKVDIVDASVSNLSLQGSGGNWIGVYSGGFDPIMHCLSGSSMRFGHSTDKNAGGFSEDMTITSSGNVGIGVTPTTKLHVDGDLRVNNGQFFGGWDSVAEPAYSWNGDRDTGMSRLAENTISFSTNATEMMRTNTTATFVEGGYSALDRVAGTAHSAGRDRIYRFLTLSQAQYNALTPDTNTLYIIV